MSLFKVLKRGKFNWEITREKIYEQKKFKHGEAVYRIVIDEKDGEIDGHVYAQGKNKDWKKKYLINQIHEDKIEIIFADHLIVFTAHIYFKDCKIINE